MRYPRLLTRLHASLFAGCCTFASLAEPTRAQDERPNILFIFADDLGKEWISCYGAGDIETPRIDALAASGMKLNTFYVMPQCTPSRIALLTGKYPFRTGWVNHWDAPRWGVGYFDWKQPEYNTFARLLRDAGYTTAATGKWQVNDFRIQPEAMKEHGFDDWLMWTGHEAGNPPSSRRYSDPYLFSREGSRAYPGEFGPDLFVDFLIDFMRENREQPMMLYHAMVLPHTPLIATPDEPDVQTPLDKHKAMVRYVDKMVGRLVDALDELDLRRRTLVIFTTDNGSTTSITGTLDGQAVSGGKHHKTEKGSTMPFVVSMPGLVPAGVESDALSDITDMLPTFLDFAQAKVPEDLVLDGVSIAPILRGEQTETAREWILSMGHGPARLDEQGIRTVDDFTRRVLRDQRFKVFVDTNRQIFRLHDLHVDPLEETNLIDSAAPEHRAALDKFTGVVESFPRTDARPLYTPLPPNPWDKKIGDRLH